MLPIKDCLELFTVFVCLLQTLYNCLKLNQLRFMSGILFNRSWLLSLDPLFRSVTFPFWLNNAFVCYGNEQSFYLEFERNIWKYKA
jgi:hypothetical protein